MPDIQKHYREYLGTAAGVAAFHAFIDVMYGQASTDGTRDRLPDTLYAAICHPLTQIKRQPLDILDVGGGDGRRLRALTMALSKAQRQWKAVMLDPSGRLTDVAKKEWGDTDPIEIYCCKLQNFSVQDRFDLILLIHSIFGLNRNTYITRIKQMLRQNGMVVIQSNAPSSFLAGLKKITDARFKTETSRLEIGSVRHDLSQTGFQLVVRDAQFAVPDVVSNDQLTQRGRQILEWIAMAPLAQLSSEIKAAATTYFVDNCTSGAFVEQEQIVIATL